MPPTISYASPETPPVRSALIRTLERLTGRQELESHYDSTTSLDAHSFWTAALEQLDVTVDHQPADPSDVVPSEGPVIVIANHPFGVLDGLAICRLVSAVRPHFRILVNSVLCRDDRVAHHFLPIDFSGTQAGHATNVRSMKTAFHQLNNGGALIIFPAGGVATAPTPFAPAEDLEWTLLLSRLVHHGEAPVVPIYFEGQNSRLFQLASQVSLTLRLALLIREALQKQGESLSATMGEPIPYDSLENLEEERLTAQLRSTTLALGSA